MTNPIIIERSDLLELMDVQADKAAARAAKLVLEGLGIKAPQLQIEITQSQAWRLGIKRARLNKLMESRKVEWRKEDMKRPHSRVWILRKSLDPYIKNPQL